MHGILVPFYKEKGEPEMISVRKALDWLAAVSTKLLTGTTLVFAALFCLRRRAAYYCTA